jgi:hypothetical protein
MLENRGTGVSIFAYSPETLIADENAPASYPAGQTCTDGGIGLEPEVRTNHRFSHGVTRTR